MSQTIKMYRVSPLVSNLAPLTLVIFLNICKEAKDDYNRYNKDKSINDTLYTIFECKDGKYATKRVAAKDLRVGNVILLHKNERIPADAILLGNLEENSQVFVRTDQLDGETDWKLKLPTFEDSKILLEKNNADSEIKIEESLCKKNLSDSNIFLNKKTIEKIILKVESPHKDIYSFIGTQQLESNIINRSNSDNSLSTKNYNSSNIDSLQPLSYENALWMNTVLASGTVIALTIYTGKDTRSALNTTKARSKSGLIESDINRYTFFLFLLSFIVSILGSFLNCKNFTKRFDILVIRYLVIYSGIIPISLKVTIDFSRIWFYTRKIQNSITGCIVRTTNIPEDLGRISYILTDKTGTLTKNEMVMKKVHIGTICYSAELNEEIKKIITLNNFPKKESKFFQKRKDLANKMKKIVEALSICHNVTPIIENGSVEYQASSPDEVAIVQWCEKVGYELKYRDSDKICINIDQKANHKNININLDNSSNYKILYVFPFTSETKRMGIIVEKNGKIEFYLKGADMKMIPLVKSDWIQEEVDLMAREGLRTLVIACKEMTQEQFKEFDREYKAAKLKQNRNIETLKIQEKLEQNMKLLGLTGVEDKLQNNVMLTLELMKNADIKTWMLTGDKIETAISIAQSTKLFKDGRKKILSAKNRNEGLMELDDMEINSYDYAVIDGSSLQVFMEHFPLELTKQLSKLESVVACRCTPTQKADLAKYLRKVSGKRVLAIGDGGNDVSMITAADIGVGIVGKEGNQASLAADYSILQFSDISELILWHGRNCYVNTARVIHYVIHRGTLFAIVQGIFCALNSFRPISLLQGFLAIAFVCVFTVCPMFCLVNFEKIPKNIVFKFPELYKELLDKKELSMKEFSVWFTISFYQASSIMILTFLLFKREMSSIISIVYSCMLVNEMLMIIYLVGIYDMEVIYAMLISLFLYTVCFALGLSGLRVPENILKFLWKSACINLVSIALITLRWGYNKYFDPETHHKLAQSE